MKVFILWGTVHCVNMEAFFGVYKNKEDCIAELKRQQESIAVDIIEFHLQETDLK